MKDTDNQINPSKGGRGIKSDYPTTTIRIPQVLKESVQEMVIKFYQGESDNNKDDLKISDYNAVKKLRDIQDLISSFKVENNVNKRQLKVYKLIQELELLFDDE
jgi:hypothetical protein